MRTPELHTRASQSLLLRSASPVNSPVAAASGKSSSPTPPGGPKTAIRRRAAADQKDKVANVRPSSTRAAGAGGSSSTMLRLYTDESPGLKADPVVVLSSQRSLANSLLKFGIYNVGAEDIGARSMDFGREKRHNDAWEFLRWVK
ncbi:Arf guanine nucleotide exchange factor sbh1 [Ciborinia camelliae]|nr:Arf guanine nucleotide exchange factor sbh1 [Ciborinia camelliae]